MLRILLAAAALLAMLTAPAGCLTRVRTASGAAVSLDSPAFREYAAAVFRTQNGIATRIAFLMEDATDPAEHARLLALEESLLEACMGLNALAAAERDGRPLGKLEAWQAARAVPACEAQARAAEAALAE
jgi:hypothetical protein